MRFNFIMGQAFPENNVVGKWIIGFSMILNDLIMANNYLLQAFKISGDKRSPEGAYFFRLTCSHFRESIKYLENINDYPDVVDLINSLEPKILQNFNDLKALSEPWDTSFVKQKIYPIRNKFFHYPNIKENGNQLTKILEELKGLKTGIYSSRILKDLRMDFGDEISNAYSFDHFIDEEDFKNTVITLVDAIKQMMDFTQGIIARYLVTLPENVVIEEE